MSRDFRIVTQTDQIEKGGMMDDCGWASLAAIANYVTGSALDCADGIAIGEKVGRHDREGKGDGSSLAQLVKAAPLVGLKARHPKTWSDVEAALTDDNTALAISVQQPIGYPESVLPISKWHEKVWAPWAKKTDPAGYKRGYGHLTAAAGHPKGAQWACPTRSGKGEEKYAIPVTIQELRQIAESHGDAPHKRVVIFTAAKVKATSSAPAPIIEQRERADAQPEQRVQDAEPGVRLPSASTKQTAGTELPDLKRVDWNRALNGAASVLQIAITAARTGKGNMGKIGAALKAIAEQTAIDDALLDAARSAITVAISVMLATGAPLLDLSTGDLRTVASAALAAGLQTLLKFIDPDTSAYGVTKRKGPR
jgi:hypothetical protein